jgi:hypothetical protein
MLLGYALLTQVVKTWFIRRFPIKISGDPSGVLLGSIVCFDLREALSWPIRRNL